MSELPDELPAYDWPPTPILDREEAAAILAERLGQAYDDLEAQRRRIAMQVAATGRPPRGREWVAEFQSSLAAFIAAVQQNVARWLELHLQPTYQSAVERYLGGGPMEWSTAHVSALTALATDTYSDFLQRAYEAERVSGAFVTAVRQAAGRELTQIAAGGRTARQQGDSFAQRLIDDYGIDHVTYRDGSKVPVRAYARMAARTKSGVAYNAGSLNAYNADGITYVEVFDGPSCGWTYHDDPDKAARSIRTLEDAARYALAHPNCGRGFGPRPDITTPEEAATAVPFGPEPAPDLPAAPMSRETVTRSAQAARAARQARRAARTTSPS